MLTAEAPANGASMATLLAGHGLVHRFIEYRAGERRWSTLVQLARTLADLRPDLLVYLTEPRGTLAIWRDVAFFVACGIFRIVGAPLWRDRQQHRKLPGQELWESEAARLARCLRSLGEVRLDQPENWAPFLSDDDHAAADRILADWSGGSAFIALGVGARIPAKDWGEDKWAALIRRFGQLWPGLGIMLIGGPLDAPRIARLAGQCRGAVLDRADGNIRVTMALLRRAKLAVVTDGGPMHLAAALGVPTVAIFSGISLPGIWHPAGTNNTVLDHPTPCRNCKLSVCTEHQGACLSAITVESVVDASLARMSINSV